MVLKSKVLLCWISSEDALPLYHDPTIGGKAVTFTAIDHVTSSLFKSKKTKTKKIMNRLIGCLPPFIDILRVKRVQFTIFS